MTADQAAIRELKTQLCAVLSLSNDVAGTADPIARKHALEELHRAIQAASPLIRTYAADLVVEDAEPVEPCKLRTALAFYANEDNWSDYEDDQSKAVFDRNTGSKLGDDKGELARKTLALI